jgi:hypothetical protein
MLMLIVLVLMMLRVRLGLEVMLMVTELIVAEVIPLIARRGGKQHIMAIIIAD